jgi:hypothetical protein
MLLGGRAFAIDMGQVASLRGPLVPGENDSKANVYSLFIGGFINGIAIHRLIMDKVHSDYGGIPMKLRPGSRLENGAEPVVDATLANQTCSDLAYALFVFPDDWLAEVEALGEAAARKR